MPREAATLPAQVDQATRAWRDERGERLARRGLDPADMAALRDAGLLLAPVPTAEGGAWEGPASIRPLCEAYRHLARVDPSVALVSSMHPAVLSYWLLTDDGDQPGWTEQRHATLASAAEGRQWGTITSEPGSGGDIMRTRTIAEPTDGQHPTIPGPLYRLTGDKHFGSGYGICDYMFTTARVEGEEEPAAFFIDTRRVLDDGSDHMRVTHEWDGIGMKATQSHAAHLEGVDAVRLAWDGPIDPLILASGGFITTLFTAVVLGILDEAVDAARAQVTKRADTLRAYEQVEWSLAELEHWTAQQAYEGALRAAETGEATGALYAGLRAKTAVAELAESSLRRITDVLGGGTFSQRSPFAHWGEDVRALGFLRPPWGLAFDSLFATSLG